MVIQKLDSYEPTSKEICGRPLKPIQNHEEKNLFLADGKGFAFGKKRPKLTNTPTYQ
jgi:hypothetical protein